ncbi:hypothetical protein PsYK624_076110 [Phanerochaete sordida]|uniref:Uncharacterized protein n=1 Tax=Phanerochaete sordida TaxID=48140 RepID=A0A9P3GAT4_9APHY|nr:hypothetical protein PsYK624_076110 [Phanerochaete sordida]
MRSHTKPLAGRLAKPVRGTADAEARRSEARATLVVHSSSARAAETSAVYASSASEATLDFRKASWTLPDPERRLCRHGSSYRSVLLLTWARVNG